MPTKTNLRAPHASISRTQREFRNGHRGIALLLTGLPAAGKSTLAPALQVELFNLGLQSIVLDGDALRGGVNSDLGFVDCDRQENIRRTSELTALLVENGQIVMLAAQRELFARRLGDDYLEAWCNTALNVCEQRDPKGHYARARDGELLHFTGISAPYEPPQSGALVLETGTLPVHACVQQLLDWLAPHARFDGQP